MDSSATFRVLCAAVAAMSLPTAAAPAGGHYAVFKSVDAGQSWARSDAGLPQNSRINAFVEVGGSILAGTDDGIYMSRDHGLSWTRSAAVRAVGRVLTLSATKTSVFAGTDRNGVVMSLDRGVSWTASTKAWFGKTRTLLAHEGDLYAGTDAHGTFVSRDEGSSWTPMTEGFPRGAQVFSLAALRGQIFAGLYGRGLYVWERRSPSWRKVGAVSPLALAASGETLLAGHNPGGIFRSDSLGEVWEPGEIPVSPDPGKAPVWQLAASPEVAIAGVSSGIYRSRDGGRHWTRTRVGLPTDGSGIAFLLGRRFVLAAVFIPGEE